MLLTLLLTGVLALQPADPAAVRDEAERLAREGSDAEALTLFQSLAAADPRDLDARVSIGRLHLRLGATVRAEGVFRSVLGENPDHVRALTGLGLTLVSQERLEEAVLLLARAEDLDPNNPDVLAALGRAHRLAGRTTLAKAYYFRADLLGFGQPDIRTGYELTRRVHDHWIALGGFGESFSVSLPDARAGDLSAGFRVTDRLRLVARGQAQQKFDRTEGRGGGGFEWRQSRRLLVRAAAQYGPKTEILPEVDAGAEVELTRRQVDVITGLQYIGFDSGADVWVASPGLVVRFGDGVIVGARYLHSWTSFGGGPTLGHRSGAVEGRLRLHSRMWVSAAYARNNESFETLSPDRLGRFRANTVGAGVRFDLRTLTSIAAGYEYQRRAGQIDVMRVTTGLIQRF